VRTGHGDPHLTHESEGIHGVDGRRASVQRPRDALVSRGVYVEALSHPLSRQAALVAALSFADLAWPEQIETAMVLASLPCVVAAAHRHGVMSIRDCPMQLHRFAYEDP
jgi:hypothetical protein